MSAVEDGHGDGHAADLTAGHDHDAHGHGEGHHGTMRDYLMGFSLSVVLTAIPFWIVMADVFRSPVTAAVVLMVFAVAQIFVHMTFFLHMNARSEGGWTLLAAIFTIVIVVIALSGSMWVMSHLHHNMSPVDDHEMGAPGAPALGKAVPVE